MQIPATDSPVSENWEYAQKGFDQLKLYAKIPIDICLVSVTTIVALPILTILFTLGACTLKFNSRPVKPFAQNCFSIIKFQLIDSLITISYTLFSLIYKIFIIIGLFFGVLFPKIGKQINAINEKTSELFKKFSCSKELENHIKKLIKFVGFNTPQRQQNALNVLGLSSTATKKEITAKYEQLSSASHLDGNRNSSEARIQFQNYQNAYQYLKIQALFDYIMKK